MVRPESGVPASEIAIAPSMDQPSSTQLFSQALALHQSGRLDEAKALYEQLLKDVPGHHRALQQMGMICGQSGDIQRAVSFLSASLAIHPDNAEALNFLGNALQDLGQFDAAIASYERAATILPDYAEAHYNKANAQQRMGLLEASVASYDRALTIQPAYADAFFNRGNALRELKRMDAAVASYEQAIRLQPMDVEAHTNRGGVLNELSRHEEAIASFDRAISLQPDYPLAHYNRGTALHRLGRLEAAASSFRRAIALHPGYAEALSNLGLVLQEMKQLPDALASLDRAIAIKPAFAEAHSNRGNILQELQQYEEAISSYERAIAANPAFAEAHFNRGIALKELQRLDAAIASYDRAIAIRPDYDEAIWNKSIALLLNGNLEPGWKLHESRWTRPEAKRHLRTFCVPLWLGEQSLQGKTILLHAEQGLGDALQFCRYAKLVSELGGRIILEAPKALLSVLSTLEGVDELRETGSTTRSFDYHCPLLSLPLAFNTSLSSIPHATRYLESDPLKVSYWHTRLGPRKGLRVGIVWSSTSSFRDDARRSLRLAEFLKAIPDRDIEIICLQKELKPVDSGTLDARPDIRFVGNQLHDLSDTAALIETLDLVVSTCTSVPHLSCALGKATWILLSHAPDWRWFLHRSDSPWYPSAKLYRQPRPGDWDSVLRQVNADLGLLSAGNG